MIGKAQATTVAIDVTFNLRTVKGDNLGVEDVAIPRNVLTAFKILHKCFYFFTFLF